LKAKLSQKDKLVKSQQSDIENLNESLEKARGQLLESKASSQQSQSQLEKSLKDRINEVENQISEAKKELRKKQDVIDEL
jgi:predicted  nucleic acid-binding Zn-ribbon protein